MMKKVICQNCNIEFTNKYRHSNAKFCSHKCAGLKKRITNPLYLVDFFYERITKSEYCWIWNGSKDKNGYGKLRFNNKELRAHRVSWKIHYGEIPKNIFVCHKCDNPSCTNPEHLFLGTAKDNTNDMIRKGRKIFSIGEKSSNAKLNETQVIEILKLLKIENNIDKIAEMFCVHKNTISCIKHKRTWKYLSRE